jgi:probable F420-dependent oxidoreductase
MGRMKIGLVLPMSDADGPGAGSWPTLQSLARRADDGGIDSLWLYDHVIFRFPDQDEGGIHEATTLLAAVAAVTRRAELGTIVLGTGFRPPALTAKMAATIDEISGGRLILGLGAGWHEPEYTAFGYPYDHRVGRFEETLRIILPLTRGERVTFHGRFHDVEDAVLLPKPRRDRMPILIAAKGERMLRLAARHADLWNTAWYGFPDDRSASRIADIKAACEAEGRDPGTLELPVGVTIDTKTADPGRPGAPGPLPPDADVIAQAFDAWRDQGIGTLQLDLRPVTEETIDLLLRARELHLGQA